MFLPKGKEKYKTSNNNESHFNEMKHHSSCNLEKINSLSIDLFYIFRIKFLGCPNSVSVVIKMSVF